MLLTAFATSPGFDNQVPRPMVGIGLTEAVTLLVSLIEVRSDIFCWTMDVQSNGILDE